MPVNSRCSIHLIAFFVSQLELNNMLRVSFEKKTLCLAIEIQIKSKWREKKVLRHRKSLKITWQLYKLTAIVTSSIDLYGTFYSMFLFVQLIG